MSHLKDRKEKGCLNCGAHVQGRYCHICGQENTEPKETVWALVSHFFNDITHFDGKFFSTVKYLIIRPGFLPAEYLKGRRASYLHPIRMYVFTSAFFFIIFFSVFRPESMIRVKKSQEEQLKELREASTSLKEKLAEAKTDPDMYAAIERSISNIDRHAAMLQLTMAADGLPDSALQVQKKLFDSIAGELKKNPQMPGKVAASLLKLDSIQANRKTTMYDDLDVSDINYSYRSQLAYDSVQKELPASKKSNWFQRALVSKVILLNTKFKDDKKEGVALFMEKFMHSLPQALFVSLPVFALILLMLYARRQFYYVDHAIFTIHLYCASFILLLFIFSIEKISSLTGWAWLKTFLEPVFILGIFFYLYKAMRTFYRQGRAKTIFKFIILNAFSFIVVMILSGVFFMLSLVQFS